MTETFLTRAGYEKLRQEIEDLKKRKVQLSHDIAEAREKGDLSENAEYHSAKDKLAEVLGRINIIQDKLQGAKLIEEFKPPKDTVSIGCAVTVQDEDGDETTYTLVGADESDPAEGRISVYSPLAQGLLHKKVGEKVSIELPAGTRVFTILKAGPSQ
ncbi:MAG TPA: transcription elongation factor GreA [Elusimicrobia bacterium]|nr:transcription elongation factor GreA [Elusimicrobiota bacterium]HBT60459.1 transcription elongation factor GreA [Elusimicrobiota bacterium]